MMQNWTKTITIKNEYGYEFQKDTQKMLSMVMYM